MSDPITRLNAALEGRYRVDRQLGEGGMATVYLADDLRHERKVALKVLKPELAAVVGAERFLAEIKTTANLQHPHILPLFDSGEADGFLFYVMPYVEGESLRERLDRQKQLPVDEAVQISKNVAEALDYAHTHGVIHRDIKPANILLQSGKPVVSDFGIALAVGAAGGGRLTETGLSLGTPHYMSPEQATGDLGVGAASDIYALGCVLYEMLVGDPPYVGSTAQAILGKIVTGEADPVTKHRRSVPPNVDAAIRRALEKVPADRFATAQAFAQAVTDSTFRHGALVGAGAVQAGTGWRNVALVLAALLAGSITALASVAIRPETAPQVSRYELTLPLGVTYSDGVAISRDERVIAFAGLDRQLYVRNLDEPDMVVVAEGSNPINPFFSPDGGWIAYFDEVEGTLKRVRTEGGGVQTVAELRGALRSGVWLDDGTIVAAGNSFDALQRIPSAGGAPEPIPGTEGPPLRELSALPDQRTVVAYQGQAESYELVAVSLETGERTVLGPGATPRALPGGQLVFWLDGALWSADLDPDRLDLGGEPVRLATNVFANVSTGKAFYAVSPHLLVYEEGSENTDRPLWVTRDGSREVMSSRDLRGVFVSAAVSPAGDRVAFEHVPTGGERDIWVYDFAQETLSRLTLDGQNNRYPFWSPDGRTIGFSSERDSLAALYARPADLSEEPRLLLADSVESLYEGGWTPDGRSLVYRRGSTLTRGQFDIWQGDAAPGGPARALLETPAAELHPALSPDGRWLAYVSDESGRREVYVRPFPGPGGRVQVSTDGGDSPVWARSGEELFYLTLAPRRLVAAAVQAAPGFSVRSREELFEWAGLTYNTNHTVFDVAPDGQRFAVGGIPPDAPGRYIVVENFLEEAEGAAGGS